jgi:tetratricopeptide (TPR) repeat protein
LNPAAARLFRLLAVHPGPDIGLPAVASLAGTGTARVRAALAELCRASLVSEPVPDRYACHDLLRAYAAELADATEGAAGRRAAVRRIADHYLHSAHRADRALDPTREPLAAPPVAAGVTPERPDDPTAWLATERPVLLAVARLTAAHGLDPHTCELARCLQGFLDMRGHWRELIAVAEAALHAAGRLGDPVRQARAHRGVARAQARLGGADEVGRHLDAALDLFDRAGDRAGLAHTHLNLAWLREQRGDRAGALDHDRRALVLFRAAGDRAGQARALNSIGWSHARLGDHRAALQPCREALALFDELGDRNGQAGTWDSLGYAHQGLGEHAAAVGCFQRAVALYTELGDRYFEAVAREHLGDAHHAAGHEGPARAAWRAAHDALVDLDHPDADGLLAKLTPCPSTSITPTSTGLPPS